MKVSIIIPFNIDRGWLSLAIRSAERQEEWKLNEDYEIIIQQGDCHVGKNFNNAVARSKGDYIKGLAEDDMLAPGCLKTLYPFAVANNLDFTCADAYLFENEKLILRRDCSTIPDKVYNLADENTIHGGTILYRRDAMPKWDEDLWTAEEYDVTLRMAVAGCRFGKIDEVVYWYRSHPRQKSQQYRFAGDEDMAVKRYRFIRDHVSAQHGGNHQRINK